MKGWRLAVFTITSIAATGCSRDPARASQAYLASGDRYVKAGQYKEAAIEYRNAAKVTPQSPAAHEKLADVSMHEHDRDTAAVEYLRAADLDPGNAAAQVRAASIYLLAGRFAEARDFAQAALRISPREVSAHVVLGEALNALHDARRGEASLREAVSIAPQSPDAHIALGSVYWSVGRVVDAEAELKRAVALAPAHRAPTEPSACFTWRHRALTPRKTAGRRWPSLLAAIPSRWPTTTPRRDVWPRVNASW